MPPQTIQQAFDLALQHHQAGRLQQAEQLYRQILAQQPNHADALHMLGAIAHQLGRNDAAVDLIGRALALNSNWPEAYNNLGAALHGSGQMDKAITACRQALTLKPDYAEAHFNLGIALNEKGHLEAAIAAYTQAVALNPNLPEAYNNLGNARRDKGYLDEAIAAYRQALAIKPGYSDAHGNLLLILHYRPGYDAQAIAEEHRRWNQHHAEPLKQFIQPHANDRHPDRRLRIGYVSPDFRQHAVAPMVLPLLASHDHSQFEVLCYAEVARPDAMTVHIRAAADQWRSTVRLSDEQLTSLIRQDQIDILVDLAGHTAGNRLPVFARKPAPVQVTRQGYPNTTGLSTIDYRMSDALADPPGMTEAWHSEQLLRLPQTNWIYQPPAESPVPLPRPAGAPITFGCFNNFAKVTEPMLRLWGRILRTVPASRLLLKALPLGEESTRRRVQQILAQEGIDPIRMDLRGYEPGHGSHLALYGQMDIALDPFPYHGTTTTCEAVWMGVPVITLAGQTHVSRVGVSLLTNVGLPELIAASPEDYLRIAVTLACDRPRLRELQSTLRSRMQASPILDAPRFARNIEAAYRDIWRKWCAKAPALR